MRLVPALSVLLTLLTISCSDVVGLEPVSGVEGKLTFIGDWDAEIQAVAVIALNDLDLENPASNLITYSNLIDPGTKESEYFIQLFPGQFYLATVGVTVDPGFFAAKLDSFLNAETIPLIIIDNDLRNLTTPVNVENQEITRIDRGIVF